jgi:hypothetical protein
MAPLALLSPSVVALPERGMTSIAATVAFGLVLPMAVPWSCIMPAVPPACAPEVSYPLELPAAPALPDAPEDPLAPPQLPPPCDPVPLLPVSPAVPLVPLLPMPPPRQELHADSPTASASKPARKTLWCFCFMINSF